MSKIKNSQKKDPIQVDTVFDARTEFDGFLSFKTSLKIGGSFKGKIQSEGFLYIAEGAEVHSEIQVGSILVAGSVKGNIVVKDTVEMLSTGKITGDIKANKLKIADGVIFEGRCEMIH